MTFLFRNRIKISVNLSCLRRTRIRQLQWLRQSRLTNSTPFNGRIEETLFSGVLCLKLATTFFLNSTMPSNCMDIDYAAATTNIPLTYCTTRPLKFGRQIWDELRDLIKYRTKTLSALVRKTRFHSMSTLQKTFLFMPFFFHSLRWI